MTALLDRPDLVVDFELMIGEMPAVPCEGTKHGKSILHDDGPGTDYWRMEHECWLPKGAVYVLCRRKTLDMIDLIRENKEAGLIYCATCKDFTLVDQWVTHLGPVGLTGS